MKSIRSFAFVAALTLSALGLTHAQSAARGRFTLPYEVHWGQEIVPAGSYEFSLLPVGSTEILKLKRISGVPEEILIPTQPPEPLTSINVSQLEVLNRGGRKFVSSMQLAKYGEILHFAVPAELASVERQQVQTTAEIASAVTR